MSQMRLVYFLLEIEWAVGLFSTEEIFLGAPVNNS